MAKQKVTLKIKRFDPEKDNKSYWAEYKIEVEPTDRLLDGLHHVKWYQDGTLTLRRSCAHGICGSDAMRINGRNMLACKVLFKDLGSTVTVPHADAVVIMSKAPAIRAMRFPIKHMVNVFLPEL